MYKRLPKLENVNRSIFDDYEQQQSGGEVNYFHSVCKKTVHIRSKNANLGIRLRELIHHNDMCNRRSQM
jgi:hypothetical protein